MVKKKQQVVAGAPEWVLTYGDMMSLLLCFFILLAAISEPKRPRELEKMLQSIREAFGFYGEVGVSGSVPNSVGADALIVQLQQLESGNEAMERGHSKEEGLEGRNFRVTNVRDGVHLQVGGRVSFDRFKAELKEEGAALVANLASRLVGQNTVIHVRGHATLEPLPTGSPFRDAMELSMARARAVADVLTANGLQAERLRLVGVGNFEPLAAQAYTEERIALNRRVEIIVTEAVLDDFAGLPQATMERVDDDGSGE